MSGEHPYSVTVAPHVASTFHFAVREEAEAFADKLHLLFEENFPFHLLMHGPASVTQISHLGEDAASD